MEIRHILAQHFRPLGILPHQAAYLAVVRMYAGQLPEAVVYELLQLPEAFIVLCYLVLQFVQFFHVCRCVRLDDLLCRQLLRQLVHKHIHLFSS